MVDKYHLSAGAYLIDSSTPLELLLDRLVPKFEMILRSEREPHIESVLNQNEHSEPVLNQSCFKAKRILYLKASIEKVCFGSNR